MAARVPIGVVAPAQDAACRQHCSRRTPWKSRKRRRSLLVRFDSLFASTSKLIALLDALSLKNASRSIAVDRAVPEKIPDSFELGAHVPWDFRVECPKGVLT